MSRLVDVVGEFLERVRAQRVAPMMGGRVLDPSDLLTEMEDAWEEARKGEETLSALAEAACRTAIQRGQSSEAMNFHTLLVQMRQSAPKVTNG